MTYPDTPFPPAPAGPIPRLLPARPEGDLIVSVPGANPLGSDMVSGKQAQTLAEEASRAAMIRRLGIPTEATEFFDEFATHMAEATGFLYGMVNLFLAEQTFIGLHNPPADSGHLVVGRTMSRDHGWCPEVVQRKKALPLHNVHASPRFSGNHVVDAVGIQAYFGVPLIHEGIAVGTVCVIDPDSRPLSDARRLRDIVIDSGGAVMRAITVNARRS